MSIIKKKYLINALELRRLISSGRFLLDENYALQLYEQISKTEDFSIKSFLSQIGITKEDEDNYPIIEYLEGKENYPIFNINGMLIKEDTWCDYGTKTIASLMIEKINSGVDGIVLSFDTQGGHVEAPEPIREAIFYAKEKGIKVSALVHNALSGGMYILSAVDAENVYYYNEHGLTGSIGVIMQITIPSEKNKENEEYKTHTIRAKESTEKNKWYTDAMNGDFALLISELDEDNDIFINTIKSENKYKDIDEKLYKGKTYNAQKAKKIGIVQGKSNILQIIKKMEEGKNQQKTKDNQVLVEEANSKISLLESQLAEKTTENTSLKDKVQSLETENKSLKENNASVLNGFKKNILSQNGIDENKHSFAYNALMNDGTLSDIEKFEEQAVLASKEMGLQEKKTEGKKDEKTPKKKIGEGKNPLTEVDKEKNTIKTATDYAKKEVEAYKENGGEFLSKSEESAFELQKKREFNNLKK